MNKTEFDAMISKVTAQANTPGALTAFIPAGRINAYICDLCKDVVVAVVRDPGRTPFRLPCANPKHGPEPEPADGLSDRKLKRLANANDGSFIRTDLRRMPDGRPITLRSVGFRVPDFFKAENATVELYRPTFDEFEAMPPGSMRFHISAGGLWFRAIGETAGDGLDGLIEMETIKNENGN